MPCLVDDSCPPQESSPRRSQQPAASSKKREAGLVFLVILSLFYFLLFLPALVSNGIPYFMDIVAAFFPLKFLTAQMLLAGEVPAWNPTYYCGVPLLANPQWGTLYPGYIPFYLVPTGWMFSLILVLHAILGSWGIYFLTCQLLKSESTSWSAQPNLARVGLIAAGCFLFQGWLWSHYAFGAYLLSIAWIPFFLCCWERFFAAGNSSGAGKNYIIIGGILLAVQIYSGAPQVTLYAFLSYVVIITVRVMTGDGELERSARAKTAMTFLFLTTLIGLALSCPQWLSSAGFLKQCQRAGGLTLAQITQGSLSPEGLLRALLGGTGFPEDAESCLYFGLPALALFFLALTKILGCRSKSLEEGNGQKVVIGYLAVIMVFALLSLRETSWLFYKIFPPYRYFHDPRRGLVVLAAIMPIFIELGIKTLIANRIISQGKFLGGKKLRAVACYLIILLVLVVLSFSLGIFPLTADFRLKPAMGWLELPKIISPEILSVILALIIGLVALRKQGAKPAGPLIAIFLGILLLDMTYFAVKGIDLKFVAAHQVFDQALAPELTKKEKRRFFTYDNSIHYSYDYTRPGFKNYLFPDLGSYYGLEDFQGYDPFIPKRYGLYLRLINKGMISLYPHHFGIVRNIDSGLLARANVGYIIGDAAFYHPFMKEFIVAEEPYEIQLETLGPYNQLKITSAVLNPDIVLIGEEVARLILFDNNGKQKTLSIKMAEHTGPWDKKLTQLDDSKDVEVITAGFDKANQKFLYTAYLQLKPALAIKTVVVKRSSKLAELLINDIALRPSLRSGLNKIGGSATDYGTIPVYELAASFPRLGFVGLVNPVYNSELAANIFSHEIGVPREMVIVEADEKLTNLGPKFSTQAKVVSARFYANKIRIKVEVADSSAFLVLRDAYFPGWKVKIDGKKERIYPVDLLFRGVVVEKGQHNIEFYYSPLELKIGGIILFATALLLLLWARSARLRKIGGE